MFDGDDDDFLDNIALGEFIERYDPMIKKVFVSLDAEIRIPVIAKTLKEYLQMGLNVEDAVNAVIRFFRERNIEMRSGDNFFERRRRSRAIRTPKDMPHFHLDEDNYDCQRGPKFLLDPLEADIITILLESIGEKLGSAEIIAKLTKLGYKKKIVKRHLFVLMDKWINQIRAERFANITVMEPADEDGFGFKEFDN